MKCKQCSYLGKFFIKQRSWNEKKKRWKNVYWHKCLLKEDIMCERMFITQDDLKYCQVKKRNDIMKCKEQILHQMTSVRKAIILKDINKDYADGYYNALMWVLSEE